MRRISTVDEDGVEFSANSQDKTSEEDEMWIHENLDMIRLEKETVETLKQGEETMRSNIIEFADFNL